MLLDKVIYTEHPVSKKLKDSLITDYNPIWTRNSDKVEVESNEENETKEEKEESSNKQNTRRKVSWQDL